MTHRCERQLPEVCRVPENKWWRCACGRRWQVIFNQAENDLPNIFETYEGVQINGPDGSSYWRPFRTKFIGGLFIT